MLSTREYRLSAFKNYIEMLNRQSPIEILLEEVEYEDLLDESISELRARQKFKKRVDTVAFWWSEWDYKRLEKITKPEKNDMQEKSMEMAKQEPVSQKEEGQQDSKVVLTVRMVFNEEDWEIITSLLTEAKKHCAQFNAARSGCVVQ